MIGQQLKQSKRNQKEGDIILIQYLVMKHIDSYNPPSVASIAHDPSYSVQYPTEAELFSEYFIIQV